jgi:hypothetical protein
MPEVAFTPPNYELDLAYRRTPPLVLLRQIEELQHDGLLLMDHLTKRTERRFIAASGERNAAQAAGSKAGIESLSFEPFRQSPAEIAAAPDGLRSLVLLVDSLSRLAAPVTPQTIRNSLQGLLGSFDSFLLLLLLVVMFFSVAVFWRVDEARSLINQTRQAQAGANDVYGRLNLLDRGNHFSPVPKDDTNDPSALGPLCNLDDKTPYQAPKTAEAEGLCSALAEQKARERILFERLRTWNCNLTQDWATFWIIRPLVAGARDNGDLKALNYGACRALTTDDENKGTAAYHWQRSERRTVTVLTLMANHIMPALLALLGASIYLLRLRQRQKAQSTLEDAGMATFARLLMPVALGGLLGLVWTGGGDVINPNSLTLQNITFSLPLFAFALGYAFDPILEWLENKIRETLMGKKAEATDIPVK